MGKPLSRKSMNRTATWRYSSGDLHAAYDYKVPIHTPVFAVRRGRVLKVVDNIPNMPANVAGKSGDHANFILLGIKYNGATATIVYAHVSPNALVKAGDVVEEGKQIALSGHNGHSTGPHLHIAAVIGHASQNFPELHDLPNDAHEPTDGLASNNTTIYPPDLAFGAKKFNELDAGDIVLKELTSKTRGSVTVRRLQHRLNGIHLDNGTNLLVTGDYTKKTRDEVTKWQVQKGKAQPGTAAANGIVSPGQAAVLFNAPRFRIVH